jgi:hypothetical protein
MVFSGGISGFFDDLYCAAVEKGYKLTHPRSWDCVLKSQAMKEGDDGYEDMIDALRTVGIEDKELFTLIREAEDMDELTPEEAENLIMRLKEKKVTVDFSEFIGRLEEDRKRDTPQQSNDLKEIFEIINKRQNPYDTFPEEKKYYSIDEIMEIIQRLGNMAEKSDSSEK